MSRSPTEYYSPDGGDCTPQGEGENREIRTERTLAIIKPNAVDRYEEIEDVITRQGFTILEKRRVHLTPEQTSDFYAEHYGKLFFPSLVNYMSSGPIVVLMLARVNAISHWNYLMGPATVSEAIELRPNSLRARYGTNAQHNGLHGSKDSIAAQRELSFFFGDAIIEPLTTGVFAKDYLAKYVNPTLLKGLTELSKNKPENPQLWLSDWLLENNPYKAKVKENPELIIDTLHI